MKKIGFLLLLVVLFSSCSVGSNIRYGNRTLRGYRDCPANNFIRWHYKNGTGRNYKYPVRRIKL